MLRTFLTALFICILLSGSVSSQDKDSVMIKKIYNCALEKGKAYEWLDYLCNKIGARLTGSENAEKAVQFTKATLETENYGRVYLQEVVVPRWRRNDVEKMSVTMGTYKTSVSICSLGGSIGTPLNGIKGNLVEITSFGQLDTMGKAKKIAGKIVFFNVKFPQHYVNTFTGYSEIGKYRYTGAQNAAKYGAIASVTRSLTPATDEYPHTGAMGYADSIKRIPACAVSTKGADFLSAALINDPSLTVEIKMNCDTLTDTTSYNVIAEIKGTEFPEEIIVVGGHLDSWDKGVGAHDDGAGCVQSMEVLHIFKELGIKPKRTIRVVLFMNEENGVRGGKKYAKEAKEKGEKHIAAIESDGGGATPLGFASVCNDSTKREKFQVFKSSFEPYGLYNWTGKYGGSDIDALKDQNVLLIGLVPDSQRYFDYHHSANDTFDKINRRELELGAASMTSLVYLLSEYGIK